MKKKRLLKAHKHLMVKFATDNLKSKSAARLEPVRSKILDLLKVDIEKQYPEKDMKILYKYDQGNMRCGIRLVCPGNTIKCFEFDEPPLIPKAGNITISKKTLIVIEKHDLLYNKISDEHEKIISNYKALIYSSTYFEDVLAVWPAVEKLRGAICEDQSTALTVLSKEMLESISKANIGAE